MAEMVCRAREEGARRGQGLGPAGPADHLVRVQRELQERAEITDSPFMGPWLANTIRQCDGLTKIMSYWTFSDVFEEQGVVKRAVLRRLRPDRRRRHPQAGVQRLRAAAPPRRAAPGGKVRCGAYHEGRGWCAGDRSVELCAARRVPRIGRSQEFHSLIQRISRGVTAWISVVDRDHGSSLTAWEAMGKPDFPLPHQQERLRAAGRLPPPEVRDLEGENPRLDLTLAPHALALVEIERHQ